MPTVQDHWARLWKQKIPHKVKLFLWKETHYKLPTLQLLNSRGIEMNPICRWCNMEIENDTHLLWNCQLAKDCWEIFKNWFETKTPISQNVEHIFNFFSGKDFAAGSNICIAATIWTIWLSRNECIFNNVKPKRNALQIIIKSRAWAWSLATGLILESQKNLWIISPIQAYKNHTRALLLQMVNKWFGSYKFMGFIDGSWKRNGNGIVQTGIWGYIINRMGSVCYIFSGPSKGSNPFEVELEALDFLCKSIGNKRDLLDNIIIASDSIKLHQNSVVAERNQHTQLSSTQLQKDGAYKYNL